MKVRKWIPYEFYELEHMENWLNQWGIQGYLLTAWNGRIAVFEEQHEPVVYRVRYIPENRNCKNTVFHQDFYVYNSIKTTPLPEREAGEGAAAAEKFSRQAGRLTISGFAGLAILTRIYMTDPQIFRGPVFWMIYAAFFVMLLLNGFQTIRAGKGPTPVDQSPRRAIPQVAVYIALAVCIVIVAAATI